MAKALPWKVSCSQVYKRLLTNFGIWKVLPLFLPGRTLGKFRPDVVSSLDGLHVEAFDHSWTSDMRTVEPS